MKLEFYNKKKNTWVWKDFPQRTTADDSGYEIAIIVIFVLGLIMGKFF
jgi:hypothetical protein